MSGQKGFIPLLFVLVIGLLGAGFYLGVKSSEGRSIVAGLTQVSQKLSGGNTAFFQVTPQANPSVIPSAKPSPQPTNNPRQIIATVSGNNLVFSGNYSVGDYDKASWQITIPKNGGAISGSTSGACNVQITGQMAKPDQDGEAKISGVAQGSCTPVPRFSFKTPVQSSFEGMVHLKQGIVQVTHNTTAPLSWRGYFELPFTPQ